ncbi:hypothetical protein [Gulbenkiania mobilis]|uniref:hypothetical protein n=1 Tax=Gulbenkiania mobilis TaxID=397457 RepID=UPI0009F96B99|nr:hypothetical protein [Gulbenkiania mobilis]
MNQILMAGDDWLSDRERKAQAKAEAARKKTAITCARKLEAASEALSAFLMACNECDDASRDRGLDDSRHILMRNINEYAGYLSSV